MHPFWDHKSGFKPILAKRKIIKMLEEEVEIVNMFTKKETFLWSKQTFVQQSFLLPRPLFELKETQKNRLK